METDELGRVLFGRSCRLRLALWILNLPSPRFYQSEPPHSVIAQSATGAELERLVLLGMVSMLAEKEQRRIYYQRTDSPLWAVIDAAKSALER